MNFYKVILLSVFFTAAAKPCFSQLKDEDHSSYVGINIGISYPSRKMSNTADMYAPWITSGTSFGASGAWLFTRYLGIGAAVNYASYNNTFVDPFFFSPNVTANTGADWKVLHVGAGPYFSYPLRNIEIEAKVFATAGSTHAYDRRIDYKNATPRREERLSYSGTEFVINPGIFVRSDIRSGFNFIAGVEGFYSRPVHTVTVTTYGVTPVVVSSYTLSATSWYLYPHVGLVYNIPHYK